MNQTLYIMQGPPGSGKSTIAHYIQYCHKPVDGPECFIFSTDEYHYENSPKGYPIYIFKGGKLGEYHRKNYERTIQALDRGCNVIVDNCNIKRKDCKKYVEYAVAHNIPVVFVRVTGNFKSIHGVPEEVIQRMRNQMETLTVESVLNS